MFLSSIEGLGPILNESRHMISPRVLNWSPRHLMFVSSMLCILVSMSIMFAVTGSSLSSLMAIIFLVTLLPSVEHFSNSV